MKSTYGTILATSMFAILLLCGTSLPSRAQYAPPMYNFDTDIYAIRETSIPDFSWHYDDYLQYSPAAVILGLKACGYEGRSSWGRMLTSDAFSYAFMGAAVNAVKYSVKRMRPDESRRNSFPSGHTATAFMMATMLHKEYGWRSPWFSIGGFTAAAVTGVSRIMNNRHWMTDVIAGAAIGIGSVHLGYFVSDKIFKEKGLSGIYHEPEFFYDPSVKHYVAELLFGRRFIIGAEGRKEMGDIPIRGGLAGVSTDVPLVPGIGITARASASSMTYASGKIRPMYSVLAGGYYNHHFARILEFSARIMAGCAWLDGEAGTDLSAGAGLSLITDNNFKIKAFADFECVDLAAYRPWLNSVVVGWSAAWFW